MTTYSIPIDLMQRTPMFSVIFNPFLNSLRIVLQLLREVSHRFSLRKDTAVTQLPITRQNNVALSDSDYSVSFRLLKNCEPFKQFTFTNASMPVNLLLPLAERNRNSVIV
jgi:hypothetical protein